MTTAKKIRTVRTERERSKLPSSNERAWTELPASVVYIIATLILQFDVVDFYSFRSTCHDWRSYTKDFTEDLSAPFFRPRKWIMLSDGNGFPTKPKCFLNTSNGRILRMRVPELNGQHKFLTTAEGLLIIGTDTEIKLLNPLTRFCIKFPLLFSRPRRQFMVTGSAVTSATTLILCITSFSEYRLRISRTIRCADKKSRTWKTLYDSTMLLDNMCFQKTLLYQDQLYTLDRSGTIKVLDLMAPHVDTITVDPTLGSGSLSFHLVESRGQMLLVCKVFKEENHGKVAFEVYKVDISHKTLIPMSSIGDQALFISDVRTLSISASCFPIIEADSVYFVRHLLMPMHTYRMGCVYNLPKGSAKNLHLFAALHESYTHIVQDKEQQSIQPYSLVDHILCYCYQRAWSKGLMYHEIYKNNHLEFE